MSGSLSAVLGAGVAAFLAALGIVLWWQAGPAVYAAFTAFGQLICG